MHETDPLIMNYRPKLLGVFFTGCLVITLILTAFYEKQATDKPSQQARPNIIFLLADDLRDNAFGAIGHPFVQTPHIDELLTNGVRFQNTYIAEPVCSPSRTSLFTGVHERVHGVGFSSSYELTDEQWALTYPAIMQENGYYTGFIGKFGVEYYTFRGQANQKFDYWYGHDGWTRFLPKNHDSNSSVPYHDAEHDIITEIMGEAMQDFVSSDSLKEPFCLSVSFNTPHGSQARSMHTDAEGALRMSSPANENPRLQGHPVYDTLYRNDPPQIPDATASNAYVHIPRTLLDQDKGRNTTYQYNYHRETNQEHHIRYHQMITGLDQAVGQLMEALEKQGIADNTVIIFASDHGLLMGEYGMGGKSLLYDLSAKIPLFVHDPRLPKALRGRTLPHLVSSLDITPTLLDLAGLPTPKHMWGESVMPLVQDKKEVPWRQELFLESLFTLRDNPFCEGIRAGDWKYLRFYDGKLNYTEADVDFSGRTPEFEQLFNLKNDPREENNLAKSAEYADLLDSLRQKVVVHSNKLNAERKAYSAQVNVERRN